MSPFPQPGAGGSSGGLLAVVSYAPAAQTPLNFGQAALAALDTTHLTIGFTTTKSGKGSTQVLVRLSGLIHPTANNDNPVWGLFTHNTTNQVGPAGQVSYQASDTAALLWASIAILVTGLTPGTAYQYDWAAGSTTNPESQLFCGNATVGSSSMAPAVMEVIAA